MTREEMLKIKWKAFMPIIFKVKEDSDGIECLLLSIHFEHEILILSPIDTDTYKSEEFHANLKFCFLPEVKLKISKK